MFHNFDKVNPKFRHLTDLLFFSDRMDLDLSGYKSLFRERQDVHNNYLLDRFEKASTIFWEEGQKFWAHRLEILFALNDKSVTQTISNNIEHKLFNLLRNKSHISLEYDVEFQQFLEYCRIKTNRNENLQSIKDYLLGLSSNTDIDSLIVLIKHFIPLLFKDMNEYVEVVLKKITQSARNFDLLCQLERRGVTFNKQPLYQLAEDLLLTRALNDKNRRALFSMMNDDRIMSHLKKQYSDSDKSRLLDFIEACDYQDIEHNHLENVKNIFKIDSSVGDELAILYADKLFARHTGHRKANADRLIKLLKAFPQIQPKKVLAHLSAHNRMNDIKYIISAFPDLKKLAAFV